MEACRQKATICAPVKAGLPNSERSNMGCAERLSIALEASNEPKKKAFQLSDPACTAAE